jgi:O-antigen/teichoic acid export membrane protein
LTPFDSTGAFRPPEQAPELQRQAVRSAGVTIFSQGLMFGTQLVGTFILARMLTPGDFGVVTMVSTFSLLLVGFGVNGFTEALLQRPDVNRRLASNLFWLNVVAGVVLSAAFAASGALLARFYHDDRVTAVTVGMAIVVLLSSTSVLHLTLLKRAMQFSSVSFAEITGRLGSVLASVWFAWIGWGYWALVIGAIVQPLIVSAFAYYQCRWLPSIPSRDPGTMEVVKYALHVYGRYCFNYMTRNTDNLLVGWRFGGQALGLYKKAYDLFLLPTAQLVAPVTAVAISALSRLRDDLDEYKRWFKNLLRLLGFVGMGLGGCLTLVGADLMRLILGSGWEMSGRIFVLFGPGIGVMLIYSATGLLHLSIGTADRWFRWGLIESAVTIGLFFVALPWGPLGLALAWTASFWILVGPAFSYAGKPIHLTFRFVLAVTWRYVIASLVAGVLSAQAVKYVPVLSLHSDWLAAAYRVSAGSLIFGVFYLAAVVALFGGFEPLRHISRTLVHALPARMRTLSVSV